MKVLIAVVTCEARRRQADAQRATWVKDSNYDVRFFLARQARPALADEVFVDAGDGYADLPAKVREVNRWAEGRYDLMLKTDDDTVMFPGRVILPQGHYTGWKQDPCQGTYCAGLAYWLSRDAMRVIAQSPLTDDVAEDRWTGKMLTAAGMIAEQAPVRSIQWVGQRREANKALRPLPVNIQAILGSCYIAGEFTAEELPKVYVY